MNEDRMEMMKMLGTPTGFDSTKGKPVEGADVSGIRRRSLAAQLQRRRRWWFGVCDGKRRRWNREYWLRLLRLV
ncbi:hypothetical protein LINGRAHAP2_LOCUS15416 [Linum grandiflorum]